MTLKNIAILQYADYGKLYASKFDIYYVFRRKMLHDMGRDYAVKHFQTRCDKAMENT